MVNRKIFSAMRKGIIAILIIFYSCNSSSTLLLKNDVICHKGKEYEDIIFIKNKEFKEVEKFIKEKYHAKVIRNIFYIKSQQLYYCEFYVYDYSVECVLISNNMKVNFYNKVDFDL
jgi:hypothetical protein